MQYSFQAAVPHNRYRNNRYQWEGNKSYRNVYYLSSERVLAEPRIQSATSCSQVLYATDWAMGPGWSWNTVSAKELKFDPKCRGWRMMKFNRSNLSPFHIIRTFNDSDEREFWKHQGKGRKMQVTSIFSFSHNVSTRPKTDFIIWTTLDISPVNAFNLEESFILQFGKGWACVGLNFKNAYQNTKQLNCQNPGIMIRS